MEGALTFSYYSLRVQPPDTMCEDLEYAMDLSQEERGKLKYRVRHIAEKGNPSKDKFVGIVKNVVAEGG